MNNHLTHQQLCDLLIDAAPDSSSSAHLAHCPACSAEFSTLQASLLNFRQASIQLAELAIDHRDAAHRPLLLPTRRTRRFLTVPAYVVAAAALTVAIMAPLRTGRPVPAAHIQSDTPTITASAASTTTESDEALLDEINQDVAASVPAPLEPLANPTGQGSTR